MAAALTTPGDYPQHEILIAPSLGKPCWIVGTCNKEPEPLVCDLTTTANLFACISNWDRTAVPLA
jgi:hypothetical protein